MIQSSTNATILDESIMPTLHVIGKDDKVIGTKMCEDLLSLFGSTKCQSLYHLGGHFVPAGSKTEKPVYIDFLERMKTICSNQK